MIVVFIVLAALVALGFYLLSESYNWEGLGIFLVGVCGATLLIMLIFLPINFYGWRASMEAIEATRLTIENSRTSDLSDLERATLTNQIVGINAKIARAKYWNQTIFNIYYPDEVMEIEPLR